MRQESGEIGVHFDFPPLQLRIIRSERAPAQPCQQVSRKTGLIFRGELICDLNRFHKCLHGGKIANQGRSVNFQRMLGSSDGEREAAMIKGMSLSNVPLQCPSPMSLSSAMTEAQAMLVSRDCPYR